jgi:hypothetical protein
MNTSRILCAALATSVLAAGAIAQSGSITTTFASNNGGSSGWGNLFDANVTNGAGLTVTNLDVNTSAIVGTNFTVDVYITPGTYVGKDTDPSQWTLVGSGPGVSAGSNNPSPVDVADFFLASGSYGVAVYYNGASPRYTNGTGSNQNYSNADIALQLGIAKSALFGGSTFNPRVWNGTIYYNIGGGCTGNPAIYCTAKVNSQGCTPSIGATGTPSASTGSGFVITTINELDGRNGLFAYSTTGPDSLPFQGGFLCVQAPVKRTPVQNSGGTPPCGGAYAIDFNAFIAGGSDPALVSGQQVWIQTWSRDPASPSSSNLSDALTFTICP